jgi:hypothetical protein
MDNVRGYYGELKAYPEIAGEILRRAIEFGLLHKQGIHDTGSSRRRNRWAACNHDIYGVSGDGRLILIQERHSESDGRYTSVKKDYYITDGESAWPVPQAKKGLVKRAANAQPLLLDAPLRVFRASLPDEWQDLIDPQCLKLSTPLTVQRGWKLLEQREDGTLVSLWDGEQVYEIGKRYSNRAQPDHGGGYYWYTLEVGGKERAEALKEKDWGREIVRFALCECEFAGNTIEYSNGKRASTYMKIVSVQKVLDAFPE